MILIVFNYIFMELHYHFHQVEKEDGRIENERDEIYSSGVDNLRSGGDRCDIWHRNVVGTGHTPLYSRESKKRS